MVGRAEIKVKTRVRSGLTLRFSFATLRGRTIFLVGRFGDGRIKIGVGLLLRQHGCEEQAN